MAEANVVIGYTSDITGVQQGISKIEALNQKMASQLAGQFSEASRVISSNFLGAKAGNIPITKQLRDMFPQLPAGLKEYPAIISKIGTTFQDTTGKMMQYTESQAIIEGKNISFNGTLKETNSTLGNMGVSFAKLLQHALVIIPTWAVLRGTMEGITTSFKNSVAGIIETDTALQKVKRSLQGTTEQIGMQFDMLKTEAEKLAVASGISTDKIIAAFQKFAQTGFSFETSMAGAQGATKLAVTTFSDATTIANTLTGAFKILVDTTGKSGSEIEQLNSLFSQMNELSKTNKFSMNDFGDALSKFAPVAKANNISLHDTVALLATLENAGYRSTTAGQLLRTSIQKLLENLDKLAPSLGVKINPALDNTTSILLKVMDAVSNLGKTATKVSPDLTAALKDIFGGIRSSQALQALMSMRESLAKNLELKSSVADLNTEYNKTRDILGNQINRYHTLNSEIGKAFLTGIIGTKDFDSAMGAVNKTLEDMQKNAEKFGRIVKEAFKSPLTATGLTAYESSQQVSDIQAQINAQITKGLNRQLSLPDLQKTVELVKMAIGMQIDIGLGPKALSTTYTTLTKQIIDMEIANKQIAEAQAKTTQGANQQALADKRALEPILKKSDFLKLEGYLRKELQASGLAEADVETKIMQFREQSNLFLAKDLSLQKELIDHTRALEDIELRRNRDRGLIDNQLEFLRLQGATNLQIVEARIEMEKMYGINQTRNDLLRNELELNKEITKEKLNQNSLSSNSLKLFQISKQFGTQTATTISDFLAGKVPVTAFENGGKFSDMLSILQKFFSSELEQRQANRFFFGGQGEGVPIPERRAMQEFQPINPASIKLPDIKTQIGQINVQIKKLFSQEETSKQIIDSMLSAIRNDTTVKDAIDEQIENF